MYAKSPSLGIGLTPRYVGWVAPTVGMELSEIVATRLAIVEFDIAECFPCLKLLLSVGGQCPSVALSTVTDNQHGVGTTAVGRTTPVAKESFTHHQPLSDALGPA